ncbi:glycosyltransferase family 25 protein [Acinetobacter sp. VNH17]|uniref:Glycosyltransferase family 25 protein n=1 Tax=Acinetobacter thutiue TaxID=2998078 RepID=A0ABT7WSP2_9GAMM|nr:glycosyltransferase family 25 protein [Acinetobacter thutiue]MCY6413594.1 glycosyltransferase family 25 protein [Acinetobacter thutiue]MDN0015703.1 glycosyltransferase family 25 protein [Acinetobacter thutiue]
MKVETYLINLDGSHERLDNATRQLNQQNFPFVRFPAYDGRGKLLSEFKEYNDEKSIDIMGRSLIGSELGCYKSHLRCIEKFLKTDADYLIVLEDDIQIIVDQFKAILDEVLNWLSKHPEIEWYAINLGAKKNKLSKKIFHTKGHDLVKAYYYPIRFIGMIWSRQGAQAFFEYSVNEMYMPVDNLAQSWLSQNGKGLSIWPPLVKPNGADSDIDGVIATQGKKRNDKEARSLSYSLKKQKRMWRDRMYAVKHLLGGS